MTTSERALASLRKIRDAHRAAGAVPIAVVETLIRELETDDGPAREIETLGERMDIERGPHGFPEGLR